MFLKRRRLGVVGVVVVLLILLATPAYADKPEPVDLPSEPVPVDAVFSGAFDGEIAASIELLENPVCYNYFGRTACVGQLLGKDVLVLSLGTQPPGALQAMTLLPYHFPPKGDEYLLFTHGGIAGGYNEAFVEGDPELQPGDSLAPDRVCAVGSFYIQPVRIRGWIEVQPGDSYWAITQSLTGDGSRWGELYDLNKRRLRLDEKVLQPGMLLMSPWINAISDKTIPYGGSIYLSSGRIKLPPWNPCFELTQEAKDLRDQVLQQMEILPLPASIVEYRSQHFYEARNVATVFSGYAEAGGWSWFASPVEARWQEEMWGVRQGDMESHVVAYGYFTSFPREVVLEEDSEYPADEPEIPVLFFRSSSDPPDGYNGPALDALDFQTNPRETFSTLRGFYNLGIPFGDLIDYQSRQFAEFNITSLEVVLSK